MNDNQNPTNYQLNQRCTPEQKVIETCKQHLTTYPNREALMSVLDRLDKAGIDNAQTRVWRILSVFRTPICHVNLTGVVVDNQLYDDKNTSDIKSVITELEQDVAAKHNDENVYLHVAAYYFPQGRNQRMRALKILKNGMNYVEHSDLLKLYYCRILLIKKETRETWENHLLGLLRQPTHRFESTPKAAATQLLFYYLAMGDTKSAAAHQASYGWAFNSNLITSVLSLYAITGDGGFNNPRAGLLAWSKELFGEFLVREQTAHSPSQSCLNNDSLYHRPEVFLSILLRTWVFDRQNFATNLIDMDKYIGTISIGQSGYNGSSRGLQFLLLKLANCPDMCEDSDFWLLMLVYAIGEDDVIPRELRHHLPRLYTQYPSPRVFRCYVTAVVQFGEIEKVSDQLIPLLYKHMLENNGGNTDNMDNKCLYDILISCTEIKFSRPLPYFVDAFIEAFSSNVYPNSFCEGMWRHVVRPCVLKPESAHNRKLMQLVDVFDKLLPKSGPLFAKGWCLMQVRQYSEAMACLQTVLDAGKKWYAPYRHMSYMAEKMGNLQLAYDYEKMAHDDPDINIPEDHVDILARLREYLSTY